MASSFEICHSPIGFSVKRRCLDLSNAEEWVGNFQFAILLHCILKISIHFAIFEQTLILGGF